MREAIGSSLLLNIVLVIVGIISAFLIGSIGYSKAFKVKNRIISIIEKYDGVCNFQDDDCYKEIENELNNMGYSSNIRKSCPDLSNIKTAAGTYGIISVENLYPAINDNSGHKFCVYKFKQCYVSLNSASNYVCKDSNVNYYFKVITFTHFDIPLISDFIEFEVSGETKSFYDSFVNVVW